ncbi:MAG: tRNA lysidine(34) synthetase TilS [Alphaproteobacteria bacterium]|nr:tRNA lysidine(34) synthetase TilS [Alphaproteobacteria bacterium]
MPLSLAEGEPISDTEFSGLMAAIADYEPQPRLLVAVSGGSDSLALLLLANRWARHRGGEVLAVTVDHTLRPQSQAEAEQVARWAAHHSIAHRLITLDPTLVRSRRPDQAWLRRLRYRALAGVARETGTVHLLLGHHQEDQAETLILRMGRGSGVVGLAAMQPRVFSAAFQTLRPLLGVSSARLRATCVAAGQDWVRDPSNQNRDYLRIKVRQASPLLAGLSLTAQRLSETAARLAETRSFLFDHRDRFLAQYGEFHPAGFVRLTGLPWRVESPLVVREAVGQVLRQVSGNPYAPRAASLDRLLARLTAPGPLDGCLGGCRLVTQRDGVLIFREAAAMQPEMPLLGEQGELVWDGRWLVRWSDLKTQDYSVGAMTLAEIAPRRRALRAEAIPARVMPTLPILRRRHDLCAGAACAFS